MFVPLFVEELRLIHTRALQHVNHTIRCMEQSVVSDQYCAEYTLELISLRDGNAQFTTSPIG